MRHMKMLLALALAFAIETPAMAISADLRGGPQLCPDGATCQSRATRDGGQATGEVGGRYEEMAFRGALNWLDSDSITLASANATKSALGTAKLVNGFYNPTTSNYAAVIMRAIVSTVSGTPAGPFFFNYVCGVTVTSANTGTIRSGILSNNPAMSAMAPAVNVTLTVSGSATTALNQFGTLGGPAAIVAGSGVYGMPEDLAGSIVVPPGCIFGIMALGAGTSHVVQSSLTWKEIKYP